ncbi:MAG: undecaprenyl/decaprenyl-phosphate alpha-N-acetylglucosaminyl 1-phosphate transferase [Clostridia bacterium]|nr:undecaprenyl/decaprenyl-phosphate alpha-N-acetylglucosaminyl 1-phosphate transferase [Clostridia bacterium]
MSQIKLPIIAAIAFGISYLFTPATIPLCKKVGAIDIPDGGRKINTVPIPRLGGLGFFLSCLLVLFPFIGESGTVAALLAGGAIIVAGGVADDVFSISPTAKLFVQAAAAFVTMVFIEMPTEFSFFGVFRIPLGGFFGFCFVLLRLIFTVNAVNFSDGLDGLASGLSATALFALFLYGMANLNTVPAVSALVLGSAVLGFLPYNKYHAKVFMGDSGSQFLGLAIAILSLGNAPGGNFTLESSLFLAVPTIDTTLSVIRRIVKRKSPFIADKGHLHHILLKAGVPHPLAVNLLVAASAVIALFTLLIAL